MNPNFKPAGTVVNAQGKAQIGGKGVFDITPGFNMPNPFARNNAAPTPKTPAKNPTMGPADTNSMLLRENYDDGYSYPGSAGYGAGGSGYTQGVNDPGTLAQYDQNIANTRAAINRLNSQRTSGYGKIDASLTDAMAQLGLGRSRAEKTYNDTKLETGQDFVSGKNTVRSQAGGALSGLLRVLGARGAGGSAAARILAPGEVARQATQQQNDLTGQYGSNVRGLDTAWGDYKIDYDNEVRDAQTQAERQKQDLSDSIEENRANLLSTIAALTGQKAAASGGNSTAAAQPFLNQANAVLNSLSNYTTKPINYTTKAYSAPELAKYTSEGPGAISVQGQQQTSDYTSPYLAALLGKRRQQQGA